MRHSKGNFIDFASISLDEQEIIIRIDPKTKQAFISCCAPVYGRQYTKYYALPQKVSSNGKGKVTAAFWTVPAKPFGPRRPRKPGSGNPAALARARAAKKRGSAPKNP